MTPGENQSELKRYRDILLATIAYHLEKMAGSVKFDGVDPYAHHCQRLKQQIERHYQKSRLERLQKKLRDMTELPLHTGDMNFGSYIKEKTGYDIDIFGNIRERIEKILKRKRIKNKNEYCDVIAMANIYRQPPVEQEKIDVLNNLRNDFDERQSKQNPPGKNNHFIHQLSEIYSPDNKRIVTVLELGTGNNDTVTQVDIRFEKGGAGIYTANGMNLDIKAYWKDNHTIAIETKKNYVAISAKFQQIQSFEDIVKVEYIES